MIGYVEDRLHVFHVDGTYERGGGTRTYGHGLRMILKKSEKAKELTSKHSRQRGQGQGCS